MNENYITKTRYREGLLCPILLWHKIHEPTKVPQPDPFARIKIEGGIQVGILARKLFPDGLLIEKETSAILTHEKSLKALQLRKPLFEAGFIYNHAYALADILIPAEDNSWDLLEVKAENSIDEKDYCCLSESFNLDCADVAFQKYTYTKAGINIRNSNILHLNKKYIYDGKKLLLEKLFITPEKVNDPKIKLIVHDEIDRHLPLVEANINKLEEILQNNARPKTIFNRNCKKCVLYDECSNILPPDHVLMLRRDMKGIRFQMLEKGITKLSDIPITSEIKDQKIEQINAHKTGTTLIKTKNIREFIDKIEYPAYFLDFETIDPAIPIFEKTHSYQKIPFQYSLHIIKKHGEKAEHHSYLAKGDVDPRPELLSQLKALLGDRGSIITYNAKFERGRLKEASEDFPEYSDWFNNNINGRIIDLEEPFDKFFYYDPKQKGSTSIKAILPVLTDCSYEGLEICEGGTAAAEYIRVTFNSVDEKDKENVRNHLEIYCKQDTQAMIDILERLEQIAADNTK
ncbi:MAG: DUF2779 domain-containing protein [Ignavibacteriaceae bacterium]|jgi:hypothetical protein|nr:DUF2779 domain-containing protein [Ignavibacteriaceae bacterium]